MNESCNQDVKICSVGEMTQISTKFVLKMDTAHYNACTFWSNMAYMYYPLKTHELY